MAGTGRAVAALAGGTTRVLAHIPFPANSSVDSILVGDAGGGFQPSFVVVPRDISGVPLDGVLVTLRFANPWPTLLESQEPGTIVDCAQKTLGRYSSPNGETVFHPRFGGIVNYDGIEVRANGVLLARIPARSTDIDGSGATSLADLSLLAEALFQDASETDLDFNLDGSVDLGDLEIMRRDLFFGVPGPVCP